MCKRWDTPQKPHCDQGQGHVVMPALPGAHLVLVHAHFPFASLEAGFNTRAGFDDPCQLCQRRLLQLRLGHMRRREVIPLAIATVVLRGIQRGLPFQDAIV